MGGHGEGLRQLTLANLNSGSVKDGEVCIGSMVFVLSVDSSSGKNCGVICRECHWAL